MEILGIDVGGSGIKGAPVDTTNGELLAERYRIPTPESGKPKPMAQVVAAIVKHFDWSGPIGVGFPAPIQGGVALTAANIHEKWIGKNAAKLFADATGCPVRVINDADAAGLAEMKFGAGVNREGVVLIVTVGTGIGTCIFTDGVLLPNCEFGHIEIQGEDAEWRASDAARKREDLSWKQWSKRLDLYLRTMEKLVWPDLILLGGGVAKKHKKFIPRLTVQAEVQPAELLNEAGIVGAALAARSLVSAAVPTPKKEIKGAPA
ncbi:MAG TPA: ROK family protein [Anaerolineales bacterium]|nr:ROK family protein [Anaerolineales bacterium]